MSRLTSRCIGILQICGPGARYGRKPMQGLVLTVRAYATHKEHAPSSLLSQHFEQQKGRREADNVGPFNLGMIPPSQKKVKKWSELSGTGKVGRVTARTTNLTVILLGAGFSALLVYALVTELFARNSPTVLYNDACEKIKVSPAVNAYLRAPYTFHNHPPLTHRPRHRNRSVNSLLTVDSTGREHLLLNFFIQASDPSAVPTAEDKPLFERISDWTSAKAQSLTHLSYDDTVAWTKDTAESAWHKTKSAFAYLSGAPLPPLPQPTHQTVEVERQSVKEPEKWSLTGVFGRMIGKRPTTSATRVETRTGAFTTGEVHADLIKDENGEFVYRYLLVNIPDSNSRHAQRIYVERMEGVPENEGILRWSSH